MRMTAKETIEELDYLSRMFHEGFFTFNEWVKKTAAVMLKWNYSWKFRKTI